MLIRSIFFTILAAFSCATAAHTQEMPPHVRVSLTPERTEVAPGDTIYIAITQDIESGWHTYWINPGDSGEALTPTWTLPTGFEAGKIHWPAPDKIMIGPLASYGYHGKVTVLQELAVPENLPSGPVTLKADIMLLTCAEICIPENSKHEIVLNSGSAQDNGTLINAALDAMPQWLDWPATYREEGSDLVVELDLYMKPIADDMDTGRPFVLMPEAWGLVDNAAATAAAFDIKDDQAKLVLRQKRGDRVMSDFGNVTFVIRYMDHDGGSRTAAFAAAFEKGVQNDMAPPLAAGGEEKPAQSSTASPEKVTVKTMRSQSGFVTITDQNLSLPAALLFALIGGLILNLMPCVFPVLSLKALKLCSLSGSELNHARLHGLLYTAGVVLSFGGLAALLLSLQAAGEEIGWGFQLQNPVFVLILSWLLFFVGLNLSGYFGIGSRFGNIGEALVRGHDYAASFFTGVLAALVATPCTAPFMAAAVGFALLQPPAGAMAIFLTLGFGLALPYLLLCFVPALRGVLPKPGAWMEAFRQFLAFPMYASAAWLVWVFSMQGGALNVMVALAGGVLIAFTVWLHRSPRKIVRLGALALALAGFFVLISNAAVQPDPLLQPVMPKEGWLPYSKHDFAALESGNDPLFVNMTAAWCITCKVNERAALDTADVREAFRRNNITAVRGDWTNRNPEIAEFLLTYGRNGVPIYVYYPARDKESRERPPPVVLPQILTPGIIIDAVEQEKGP